jgi:hypothetical protein
MDSSGLAAAPDPAPPFRLGVGPCDLWAIDDGAFTVSGDFLAVNAPPLCLSRGGPRGHGWGRLAVGRGGRGAVMPKADP